MNFKKNKYRVIGIAVFFVLFATSYYFLFKKSAVSVCSQTPEFEMSASGLAQKYAISETDANSLYLEKVILLRGPVLEFSNSNIILGEEGLTVNCSFNPGELKAVFQVGEEVEIYGICTGLSLMDVCLKDCCVAD